MTGYEIVQDEIYTNGAGGAAKVASAPSGKKVVGGGFRFSPDSGNDGVTVKENGPYAGVIGGGDAWYAHVVTTGAGTLRVHAICVDA